MKKIRAAILIFIVIGIAGFIAMSGCLGKSGVSSVNVPKSPTPAPFSTQRTITPAVTLFPPHPQDKPAITDKCPGFIQRMGGQEIIGVTFTQANGHEFLFNHPGSGKFVAHLISWDGSRTIELQNTTVPQVNYRAVVNGVQGDYYLWVRSECEWSAIVGSTTKV